MTRLGTIRTAVPGRAVALATVLTGVLAAGAAIAARPPVQTQAAAVRNVLDCQKIEDGVQRLACYDTAVAAMAKADATGDLVTVDREQRRAARHQAFGLTLPSLAFLDRGEKPEEINRIVATVASASQNPYGKWTIKLDDGAVWRQTDDNQLVRAPHAGSSAEIRRGLLNDYTMKLDGQFPIRVHRDN